MVIAMVEPTQPSGHGGRFYRPTLCATKQRRRKGWGIVISGELGCNGGAWTIRPDLELGVDQGAVNIHRKQANAGIHWSDSQVLLWAGSVVLPNQSFSTAVSIDCT